MVGAVSSVGISTTKTPEKQRNVSDKKKVNLLLVDDHPLVTEGLTRLLEQEEGWSVAGIAHSAPDAVKAVKKRSFDLALVDISLNGVNGFDLIKEMKAERQEMSVLVLTMHREMFYAERAIRAGADGFVTKHAASEELKRAIKDVLDGTLYISNDLGSRMLTKYLKGRVTPGKGLLDSLTDREVEVMSLIGEGGATREIAETLGLSVKTVEAHRANIKNKLGLKSGPALVRFAVQWRHTEKT